MRPEAGWYPDPSDRTQLRWWDGRAWTHERTSAHGAVPVHREDPPEEGDPPRALTPPAPHPASPPATAGPSHAAVRPPAQPPHPPAEAPGLGYRGTAMTASGVPLAGQGMRLLARMVDWGLLGIVQFLLVGPWRGGYLAAFEAFERSPQQAPDILAFFSDPGYTRYVLASVLIGLTLTGLYEVMMVHYRGATLGKMVCRIKVVSRDGGRVGWGQAIGRWFVLYPLAQLTCYLFRLVDGAWCLFDPERDCLHDKMVSTQVVVGRR